MTVNQKLCKDVVFNTERTGFAYLLESPHWTYEEIKKKQKKKKKKKKKKKSLPYILICSLRILYKSKFILMTTSLETDAVVVTGSTVPVWIATHKKGH